MLRALRQCLSGLDDDAPVQSRNHPTSGQSVSRYLYLSEKPTLSQPGKTRLPRNEVADKLVSTLCNAPAPGKPLQADLDAIVHEAGWWDRSIAERVLAMLEKILEGGLALGPAMHAACRKVYDEAAKIAGIAADLAKAHPILTGVVCTVIALGILFVLAPWMLEALGFTKLGPLADSFAAAWQRTYGGRVPVGSLFSYLQRLGMTWNGSIAVHVPVVVAKL